MMDSASSSMWVLGGYSDRGPGYNATLWSLSLAGTPQWVSRTPFDSSRASARRLPIGRAQSIDGFFYLFGGLDNGGHLNNDLAILPSELASPAPSLVDVPQQPLPSPVAFTIGPNPFRQDAEFTFFLPSRVDGRHRDRHVRGDRVARVARIGRPPVERRHAAP